MLQNQLAQLIHGRLKTGRFRPLVPPVVVPGIIQGFSPLPGLGNERARNIEDSPGRDLNGITDKQRYPVDTRTGQV